MKVMRISLIMAFLVSAIAIMAQYTENQIPVPEKKFAKYLDFRFENGAMLSNDTELGDQIVNSSYYNGIDFRLGFRRTDPYDIYSNVYRRPYLGLGWYLSTFHNEDVGKPHALYFFLTIPFAFEKNKKLTFSYTGAFGLSYNFNPYDTINNPANIFIGSYRNCYVHLGLVANYKFTERLAANATIGFKHFSNGSFKQPNYGINLVPFTLGLSYRLDRDDAYHYKTTVPDYYRHNLVNIALIAGSKNYEHGEDNYLKAGISVNFLRQINFRYRLGLGLDMFYAAQSDLRNDSEDSDFSKSVSAAVVGSWEWAITKNLYIPIGIGIYFHRNEENNEIRTYYERVGIRYRFAGHYFAGVTIKAHQGVADFFEWTLGYTFHNDKNTY
jgi:hypothetical protein